MLRFGLPPPRGSSCSRRARAVLAAGAAPERPAGWAPGRGLPWWRSKAGVRARPSCRPRYHQAATLAMAPPRPASVSPPSKGEGGRRCRPSCGRHPSPGKLRARGSVEPLQRMDPGVRTIQAHWREHCDPSISLRLPRPLNKHLVNTASGQVLWFLPRKAVTLVGNAQPLSHKPLQFTDEKTEAQSGQPLAQSRTARQGCARPPWHHAPLCPFQDPHSLQCCEEDPGLSAAPFIPQQTLTQHCWGWASVSCQLS